MTSLHSENIFLSPINSTFPISDDDPAILQTISHKSEDYVESTTTFLESQLEESKDGYLLDTNKIIVCSVFLIIFLCVLNILSQVKRPSQPRRRISLSSFFCDEESVYKRNKLPSYEEAVNSPPPPSYAMVVMNT